MLRIENTSESDPHSYEATKTVAKIAQRNFWGFNGIRTPDLQDTGVMLYQIIGQEWVQFTPVTVYEERCIYSYDINHIYTLQIKNTSESDPRGYEATKAVAKEAQKKSVRLQLVIVAS